MNAGLEYLNIPQWSSGFTWTITAQYFQRQHAEPSSTHKITALYVLRFPFCQMGTYIQSYLIQIELILREYLVLLNGIFFTRPDSYYQPNSVISNRRQIFVLIPQWTFLYLVQWWIFPVSVYWWHLLLSHAFPFPFPLQYCVNIWDEPKS